ncbi:MAG: pyrroline-5-carboxylate reductase family protein, partial [Panacagrimonas sp.]
VTSKRGTTEAALNHLENAGLRRTVEQALRAAHDRSQQLGDEIAAANQ